MWHWDSIDTSEVIILLNGGMACNVLTHINDQGVLCFEFCKIILDQEVLNHGIYQKKEILSVMIFSCFIGDGEDSYFWGQ